jgi:hypothetical protein
MPPAVFSGTSVLTPTTSATPSDAPSPAALCVTPPSKRLRMYEKGPPIVASDAASLDMDRKIEGSAITIRTCFRFPLFEIPIRSNHVGGVPCEYALFHVCACLTPLSPFSAPAKGFISYSHEIFERTPSYRLWSHANSDASLSAADLPLGVVCPRRVDNALGKRPSGNLILLSFSKIILSHH